MPNNGRITLCPFYRDEKNLSISCEDTYRTFRWPAQKKKHMDRYCDKNWKECPHARKLNGLYSRMGDDERMNTVEKLRHTEKELRRELKNLSTVLGKSKKRENTKDEEIKSLRRQRDTALALYSKTKNELNDCRGKEDAIMKQFNEMAATYEARLAYMMQLCGGFLDEVEARRWARSHEYEIRPAANTKTGSVGAWFVEVQEVEDGTSRFARALSEAGGREDETIGCEDRADEEKTQ